MGWGWTGEGLGLFLNKLGRTKKGEETSVKTKHCMAVAQVPLIAPKNRRLKIQGGIQWEKKSDRLLSLNRASLLTEKLRPRKIVSSFSAIKLCFVINVLNNYETDYPAQSCGIYPEFSQLGLTALIS